MVLDQRLIKRHRNDVLNALLLHSLEPTTFKWSDVQVGDDFNGYRMVSLLEHEHSDYFALFDYIDTDGAPYFLFSPGINTRADRYTSQIGNRWELHVPYIEAWAQRLKAEIEAPTCGSGSGRRAYSPRRRRARIGSQRMRSRS